MLQLLETVVASQQPFCQSCYFCNIAQMSDGPTAGPALYLRFAHVVLVR